MQGRPGKTKEFCRLWSISIGKIERFADLDIIFIFHVSFAMNILEISHDFEVSKSLQSIAELKKLAQAMIWYWGVTEKLDT